MPHSGSNADSAGQRVSPTALFPSSTARSNSRRLRPRSNTGFGCSPGRRGTLEQPTISGCAASSTVLRKTFIRNTPTGQNSFTIMTIRFAIVLAPRRTLGTGRSGESFREAPRRRQHAHISQAGDPEPAVSGPGSDYLRRKFAQGKFGRAARIDDNCVWASGRNGRYSDKWPACRHDRTHHYSNRLGDGSPLLARILAASPASPGRWRAKLGLLGGYSGRKVSIPIDTDPARGKPRLRLLLDLASLRVRRRVPLYLIGYPDRWVISPIFEESM